MSDLTRGPALRGIIGFAVPLVIANAVQQGHLLADSIIVGRFVGVNALASIGVVGPMLYLLSALYIGVGTAFSIRLANITGSDTPGHTRGVVRALVLFTAVWTVSAMGFAALAADFVLRLMGVEGEVAQGGLLYFRLLSVGFPVTFGLSALSVFLRGVGDARASMWFTGLSSLLNAALALLMVGVFGLGLAGAALATVIASTVALTAGLIFARRRYSIGPRETELRVRDELTRALRLGTPIAAQHVVLSLGIMLLVWIIEPFGPAALATFTVASRLELFAAMIFLNLSGALTMFTAQNVGAGSHQRIRHGLRQTIVLTVGISVVASIMVTTARSPIAALFTADPLTQQLTVRLILITYPFFVLYTVMVVIHGFLNGLGRTALPLICTILAFVFVQIPAAYVLREPFGITGVMWSVVASWSVGLVYSLIVARRHAAKLATKESPDRTASRT